MSQRNYAALVQAHKTPISAVTSVGNALYESTSTYIFRLAEPVVIFEAEVPYLCSEVRVTRSWTDQVAQDGEPEVWLTVEGWMSPLTARGDPVDDSPPMWHSLPKDLADHFDINPPAKEIEA